MIAGAGLPVAKHVGQPAKLERAELNRRRKELWSERTERLRSLIPKALEVLERELEGKRGLQAAMYILKVCLCRPGRDRLTDRPVGRVAARTERSPAS